MGIYIWSVIKIRIAHVEICECIYLLNTALCNLLKHVSCWNICVDAAVHFEVRFPNVCCALYG